MNNRGQIASLDFILSVVVVVLALGLIMQTVEVNQYYLKQTADGDDLALITENAAEILITHPKSTCNMKNDQGTKIADIINCIYKKESEIRKADLGIPNGYECNLLIEAGPEPNQSDCTNHSLNAVPDHAYTATRKIVYVGTGWQGGGGGDLIPKVNLMMDCIMAPIGSSDCELEYTTVSLSVWKA